MAKNKSGGGWTVALIIVTLLCVFVVYATVSGGKSIFG